MSDRENTTCMLLSQEQAIALSAMVNEECLKATLVITRDLCWIILATVVLLLPRIESSTKIWVGTVALMCLARAVLFAVIFMFGALCYRGMCLSINGLLISLLLLAIIALEVMAFIMKNNIPSLPSWLIIVVPVYYIVFNVLFHVIGSRFLRYVDVIAGGEHGTGATETYVSRDVENSNIQ